MKTTFILSLAVLIMPLLSSIGNAQNVAINEAFSTTIHVFQNTIDEDQVHKIQVDFDNADTSNTAFIINYSIPEETFIAQFIIQNECGIVTMVSKPLQAGKGEYHIPLQRLNNGKFYCTLTIDYAEAGTIGIEISGCSNPAMIVCSTTD
ncbi:MAG: hypothetical protein ACKO7B_11365 [Flavobacteriales bacterium]